MPGMRTQSWLKKMLPDFLSMCSILSGDVVAGVHVIGEAFATLDIEVDVWVRLTKFECPGRCAFTLTSA